MSEKNKFKKEDVLLMKRYLLWCYKTTKESLDRIDRYFTQLKVDGFMLDDLRTSEDFSAGCSDYKKLVDDFALYMEKKEQKVLPQKYVDQENNKLTPDYQYLRNRFKAIEKAIIHFLGSEALDEICRLYEAEMTRRILEAREHI